MAAKSKTQEYVRHNKVKLVKSGAEYFSLLEQIIDEATETIHLQTYIFDEDETGTTIANALIRAAERGVKVWILLDGYGSQKLSHEFIKRLTEAGIFFRKFQPIFKSKKFYLGRRLHHKLVVVDSHRCTVAGLNISNRYNDTAENAAWLDWALYAEGEIASHVEELCKSKLKLKRPLTVPAVKHHKPKEICLVGLRVNDWIARKSQIYKTYLTMFRDASSHLTIMSAYFLPGRSFRKNLADAAKRGVKIKVVMTGTADLPVVKYAERYIYRWLFRNNIEVYEYQKNVLHCKIAVCDSKLVTVGSFNVNNLSTYASVEANLDVNDSSFATCVEKRLNKIIIEDCIRVTEEDFRKRINLFVRAGHKMAYEIIRFLFFLSTKHAG